MIPRLCLRWKMALRIDKNQYEWQFLESLDSQDFDASSNISSFSKIWYFQLESVGGNPVVINGKIESFKIEKPVFCFSNGIFIASLVHQDFNARNLMTSHWNVLLQVKGLRLRARWTDWILYFWREKVATSKKFKFTERSQKDTF